MSVATRNRVLHLCKSTVISFQKNVSRKQWKRKELADAQQMHQAMLMDICTKHVVTIGLSKLKFDIVKRTKALADGLQLAAPYAMHWLLKTRHRLQNRRRWHLSQDSGRENVSANCTIAPTVRQPVLAQRQLNQSHAAKSGELFQSTTVGGVAFPTTTAQHRKQVCS